MIRKHYIKVTCYFSELPLWIFTNSIYRYQRSFTHRFTHLYLIGSGLIAVSETPEYLDQLIKGR